MPAGFTVAAAHGTSGGHAGLVAHRTREPAGGVGSVKVGAAGKDRGQESLLHDVLSRPGIAALAAGYGTKLGVETWAHGPSLAKPGGKRNWQ